MMGTGKSVVGKALEQKTGLPRFDTDEIILSKSKMPISEIFDRWVGKYERRRVRALADLKRALEENNDG